VPVQLDDDWSAYVILVDPALGVQREQMARFALKLATQIAPPLHDHYLARRLRTRAQALERSRIARDLHDGVTQSLLGLEMEVVVLQRRAIAEAPQLVPDLSRVHGIVRDEVVTVRELMEGIRVGDVESAGMLQHLTEVVDRFSRYTGIAARFVSDGRRPELSAYSRRQVARIVHEALVNVRKHSGADRVLVRADVDDGWWRLSIEDDGKGFSFAGRKTLDELVAQHQGPRTIVERLRIVGGDLAVESRPGFGARLEVAVPLTPVS
jgi:signal transduction histidine kinase